ncbi:MAG: hypothetical protein NVS3B12_02910 [Acidimicrobiales bacterium]
MGRYIGESTRRAARVRVEMEPIEALAVGGGFDAVYLDLHGIPWGRWIVTRVASSVDRRRVLGQGRATWASGRPGFGDTDPSTPPGGYGRRSGPESLAASDRRPSAAQNDVLELRNRLGRVS